MTFKDLQKAVQSLAGPEPSQLLLQLKDKPFWIWDRDQHKLEHQNTKGSCCFNHIIGLPQKDDHDMRRGYSDIMFVWLGAVVDIPLHAYKVMSSLGPRLYFFRLPFVDVTAQDLFLYLTDKENFTSKYRAIEEALFDYLRWFEVGPTLLPRTPLSPHLRKIEWDSEKNDVDAMQCISNLALLLGYLRREGRAYIPDKYIVMDSADDEKEQKYSYFTGEVEDIKRAGQVLTNLARGHALSIGRNYITMEDVGIVVKTVLSTSRIERVKAFIALLDTGYCSKYGLQNYGRT
jgi:hypothetical protein